MEEIYAKYPYVTQNTISRDFPYITFPDFKKILRCFNITKDKLFPLHIIETRSEDELAAFALKAKESAGYKKMIEQKSQYFEKDITKIGDHYILPDINVPKPTNTILQKLTTNVKRLVEKSIITNSKHQSQFSKYSKQFAQSIEQDISIITKIM